MEQMMAAITQMQQQLQQQAAANTNLQQQVQQQQAQLQGLTQQNQQLQAGSLASFQALATLPDLIQSLKEQLERNPKAERGQLVDAKGIGKPYVFQNDDDKFRTWAAKAESFMVGALGEKWRKAFEWAVESDTVITVSGADDVWGSGADDGSGLDETEFKNAVGQIYTALTQLTDGESFDLVRGAGPGNGLESWRKLHRRFDPATGGRKRNLLKSMLNPGRCTYSELGSGLEKWEDMVKRYESRKNDKGEREKLGEDIKMSTLESLVPEDLEKHLLMNQSRLKTYELMREEIVGFVEARHGTKINEPRIQATTSNAMDVDALGKAGKGGKGNKGWEKGGKGKEGGKGVGKVLTAKFDGECRNCGKWGHKAETCWSQVKAKGGGKESGFGAGKGKGKSEKGGKGKGKGKGKSAGALDSTGPTENSDTTTAAAVEVWSADEWHSWNGVAATGSLDFASLDVNAITYGIEES